MTGLTGRQLSVWLDIVLSCRNDSYHNINVAGQRRREAIIAIDNRLNELLVESVNYLRTIEKGKEKENETNYIPRI